MPTTHGSRFIRRVLWGWLMTDTVNGCEILASEDLIFNIRDGSIYYKTITVNGCEILASIEVAGNNKGRYILAYNKHNSVHPYVTAWLRYDDQNQWYWGDYLETIEEAKRSLFDRALAAL